MKARCQHGHLLAVTAGRNGCCTACNRRHGARGGDTNRRLKAAQTRCKRDHVLPPPNPKTGKRRCLKCEYVRQLERFAVRLRQQDTRGVTS